MQEVRLSAVSYVVLGFVEWAGEATPYRLKQLVAGSVGNFWTLQHAQLYTEPERLARAGYLDEERERGGRRRKLYRITAKGRQALEEWRAEPTDAIPELRAPALLKLFFGAEPGALAPLQIEAHRRKLAEYEEIRDSMPDSVPEGPRLALEAGIASTRQQIEWWRQVANDS
ncbi:MAG TPA: PadR family transcriptional regulator [Thermoleophilaceae bacterium]|nr:PadR family transcriptional regulator [Thermoleophilaceae bacterium]